MLYRALKTGKRAQVSPGRNAPSAMSPPEGIDSLSREELLALVLQLQHKLIELEASVLDLRAEVDRLTREKERRAAPFSKGTRPSSPSVQAANLGKAPSLFARYHAQKQSRNLR